MGLVVEPGNRYAFFSSSRTGGKGQDDIYLLKSLPMTKPVIAEQDIIVMDNSKMQRLQGIPCIITTSCRKSFTIMEKRIKMACGRLH
jgi:hypothetical protein